MRTEISIGPREVIIDRAWSKETYMNVDNIHTDINYSMFEIECLDGERTLILGYEKDPIMSAHIGKNVTLEVH
ncbi:hypothetical protein [Staphylococcus felis]|uniref:Uncharacterized protein n=1 Tax=Staphylococcus felis TaxID=46127 RepID=A0ABS0QM64_9STAP|nr:hypothetical protein [Staphylococcus felis]MBH9580101.1 hypothetical protein [Staphylococcus felis]REI09513.1 hypothetical protein DOS69_01880 [Staphylococcus felis]REI33611.1 hypothetical protein DOS82_05805 [Staphylococcus felis]